MSATDRYGYRCGTRLAPVANFCTAYGQAQSTDAQVIQQRSGNEARPQLVRVSPRPADRQNHGSAAANPTPSDLLRFLRWVEWHIVAVTIGLVELMVSMCAIMVSFGIGKPDGENRQDTRPLHR